MHGFMEDERKFLRLSRKITDIVCKASAEHDEEYLSNLRCNCTLAESLQRHAARRVRFWVSPGGDTGRRSTAEEERIPTYLVQ